MLFARTLFITNYEGHQRTYINIALTAVFAIGNYVKNIKNSVWMIIVHSFTVVLQRFCQFAGHLLRAKTSGKSSSTSPRPNAEAVLVPLSRLLEELMVLVEPALSLLLKAEDMSPKPLSKRLKTSPPKKSFRSPLLKAVKEPPPPPPTASQPSPDSTSSVFSTGPSLVCVTTLRMVRVHLVVWVVVEEWEEDWGNVEEEPREDE